MCWFLFLVFKCLFGSVPSRPLFLHHHEMCSFPKKKKSPLLPLQVWPNLQPAINPFTTNSINLFWRLNIYGCLRFSQGPGLCQRLGPELIHLELLQASYLTVGVKSKSESFGGLPHANFTTTASDSLGKNKGTHTRRMSDKCCNDRGG